MALSDIRKAFIDWAVFATNYDADHVVWLDQNMPRPTKPYLGMRMTAMVPLNHDRTLSPNDSGAALVVGDREFTLSLQAFGDERNTVDPLEELLNLHLSLSTVNAYAILQAQGIAYVDDLLGPTDAPSLKDTEYERTAVLDLLMRIPWSTTDTGVGFIERVKADGEYRGPDDQVVATTEIDVEVPTP